MVYGKGVLGNSDAYGFTVSPLIGETEGYLKSDKSGVIKLTIAANVEIETG